MFQENILSQPEPPDRHLDSMEDQTPRSQVVDNGGPSSAFTKRKSCVLEISHEEEVEANKRKCHSLPSSSSSSLEDIGMIMQRRSEWETELSKRQQQQEEEDWQFALLLQEELNEDQKQRATNRRKGTDNAYLLRQKRVSKENKGTSSKTIKTSSASSSSSSSPPSKSTKTPPSSSSSGSRGSKQITLTEMFTSLSS